MFGAKKDPRAKMPFGVQLGVLALICYLIYSDYSSRTPDPKHASVSQMVSGAVDQITKTTEALTKPKVTTLTGGTGLPARCGDKVHFMMKLSNSAQKEEPLSFDTSMVLGQDDLPIGLTKSVEGMQLGEVREAIIPPHLVKSVAKPLLKLPADATLHAHITLDSIKSPFPAPKQGMLGVMVFDKGGDPVKLRCGDEITFEYQIFNDAGVSDMVTPVKLHTTVGSSELPAALVEGLQKLKTSETLLILPAGYGASGPSDGFKQLDVKKLSMIRLSILPNQAESTPQSALKSK